MKTIVKTEANPNLEMALSNGWSWEEFRAKAHGDYLAIKAQALSEQRCECAYTGLWLGEGTSQLVHIDHFRKKALYPNLRFDWHNLFAAAKDLYYGSDYKDSTITGPLKKANNCYQSFWSPLEPNLEDKFWYRQDGKILPHPQLSEREQLLAQNTIDMYNLNAPDLKYKRRGVIESVRGLKQLDDEDLVRECMKDAGFSFVVDFELRNS